MSIPGAVQVFNWCDPSQSMCDKNKKNSPGFSAPSLAQTASGPPLTTIFVYHSQHSVFLWAFPPGSFHATESVVLMDFIDCPQLYDIMTKYQFATNF